MMTVTFESVDDLALALRDAAEAHGRYEAQTGEHDAEWPTWYAGHMMRTLDKEVHRLSGSDAP